MQQYKKKGERVDYVLELVVLKLAANPNYSNTFPKKSPYCFIVGKYLLLNNK